ncbi:hypothetical protein VitviT2T_008450 [Vitis vinifera]|uniref:EngB-type G domain-containing protein n=2 Tax=Vitis vinifera TaxID=29760 RepID=A0ABY9C2B5_VITVI
MSDKPGLTQTMNFFNLGSKLCVVDLPGYSSGYGKTEVKDAWEELVSMRLQEKNSLLGALELPSKRQPT